jgi:hypothetical protein
MRADASSAERSNGRCEVQVEQKRSCTACGSESAADASFCWRCLTPFAQVPPPPPIGVGHAGPNGVGARPMPAPIPPTPVDPPRSSSKVGRALVSVVAAFAGYFGVQYLLGGGPSLPDTLAGSTRLTDAQSKEFERYTSEEGDKYGIDAEGGVYGVGGAPRFFVIVVDAAAIETTDQLFEALVTGFSQAGATVDQSGRSSGQRGDSEYRCVTAAAAGQQAVACMWRDADNVGIVFEMPGSTKGTRRLLWQIHDTVVG